VSVTAIVNRITRLKRLAGPPPKKATATAKPKTDRLAESIALWRKDFGAFATRLDIVDKEGVRGKLRPNAIQSAFEVSRSENGRDIVLKPRQVGLTTWELARDLWVFLTKSAARVVVVVQTDSEHKPLRETSEKIRIMLESLEADGLRFEWRAHNVSEWVLGDSSLRIIEAGASEAKAQKQGRGGTIHRLHVTELAFFEFARETMNALLEAVPSTGEVCIESTANGAAGVFHERYQRAKLGTSDYKPHFFRWLDQLEYRTALKPGEIVEPQTPREKELVERYGASSEQVKWYRAKVEDKSQDLVDQEYPLDEETCWLVAGRTFFDRTSVTAMRTRDPLREEMHGQGVVLAADKRPQAALRIWKDPIEGARYAIIADPSEGTGGDPGAATVHDRATGEHLATLHGQFPPGGFAELLHDLGHRYNRALVVVERNNHGHAVIQALVTPPKVDPPMVQRATYPNVYKGPDEKYGWVSTAVTRTSALDALEDAQRKGHYTTPDARVRGEMLVFIVNKNGKAEAASGAHDDLVICAAIGWNVMRVARPKPPPPRGVVNEPLLPFG
jgi:hypothetical protein